MSINYDTIINILEKSDKKSKSKNQRKQYIKKSNIPKSCVNDVMISYDDLENLKRQADAKGYELISKEYMEMIERSKNDMFNEIVSMRGKILKINSVNSSISEKLSYFNRERTTCLNTIKRLNKTIDVILKKNNMLVDKVNDYSLKTQTNVEVENNEVKITLNPSCIIKLNADFISNSIGYCYICTSDDKKLTKFICGHGICCECAINYKNNQICNVNILEKCGVCKKDNKNTLFKVQIAPHIIEY